MAAKSAESASEGVLANEYLLVNIFKFLRVKELLDASQVCKFWYQASHAESLWRELCLVDFRVDVRIGMPRVNPVISDLRDPERSTFLVFFFPTFYDTYADWKKYLIHPLHPDLDSFLQGRVQSVWEILSGTYSTDPLPPTLSEASNENIVANPTRLSPAIKACLLLTPRIPYPLSEFSCYDHHVVDTLAYNSGGITSNTLQSIPGTASDIHFLFSSSLNESSQGPPSVTVANMVDGSLSVLSLLSRQLVPICPSASPSPLFLGTPSHKIPTRRVSATAFGEDDSTSPSPTPSPPTRAAAAATSAAPDGEPHPPRTAAAAASAQAPESATSEGPPPPPRATAAATAAAVPASDSPSPTQISPPALPEVSHTRDGALRWLETYAAVVLSEQIMWDILSIDVPNTFLLQVNDTCKAVTRGIAIGATPLYIPEISSPTQHVFAYRITMRLLHPLHRKDSEENRNKPLIRSCVLRSRFWRVADGDGRVEEVEGPGVIGLYPVLSIDDMEPFVYESRTSMRELPGTMGGYFVFEILNEQGRGTGELFRAIVPTFTLAIPPYIM